MALGPQIQKKSRIILDAEKVIDANIKLSDGGRVIISLSLLPRGFTHEHWLELMPKYHAAGWKTAKWVSDQKDGDYLDFDV